MVRVVTQSLKILSILVIALLTIGGSVGFFTWWTNEQTADDLGVPVRIQITQDDDSGSIAEKLSDRDLINWEWYFELRVRFSDGDFVPGTYILRKGMSASDIINLITDNVESDDEDTETASNGSEENVRVTFIEGQRVEEFAQTYEEAGLPGGAQAFIDATFNQEVRSIFSFLNDLPQDAPLDGYLFPSTYDIPAGSTAEDVVIQMLGQFDIIFTPEMRDQAEESGMTIHEVLIVASLVERETAVPIERPIVASVYLNRIEAEMPLQADPILQYNIGDQGDGNWWPLLDTELLEAGKQAGFNTYEEPGLPPNPIASPGLASIQAVLEPEATDYLYFVAKNDGSSEHVFANTYEEHINNMCTYNPDFADCQ